MREEALASAPPFPEDGILRVLHGHTSINQPWGRITDAVAENEALMRDDAMTLPVETGRLEPLGPLDSERAKSLWR